MTWHEKEKLREDITILRILAKWMLDNHVPRDEYLKKLEKHKKRIRQELKDIYERDEQKEIVFCADELYSLYELLKKMDDEDE